MVFLMLSTISNAQMPKAAETLTKVETYYKANSVLDLEVTYTMYKGHIGNNRTESYKGSIYKKGDTHRVKILDSEVLQFQETQLTIDNQNKTISYHTISEKDIQKKSPLNMSAFLKYYKETSSKVKGTTIIHELTLENKQLPMPYNKIEIHINKHDYSLTKQVLYLSKKIPFVGDNGKYTDDVGRMEIAFKKNPNPLVKVPSLQDYIILELDKKPRVSQAYARYNIIDQTNL